MNRDAVLLPNRQSSLTQFNRQRIFEDFLNKPGAEQIGNHKRPANDQSHDIIAFIDG